MEEFNNDIGVLDLMVVPCFCVSENRIIKVNAEAARLFLAEGMELTPMLETGIQEYADFSDGCLFLKLKVSGQSFGASVCRLNGMDVFTLDPVHESSALRAMALAARELREPLSGLMINAEHLIAATDPDENPGAYDHALRLNRNIAQLMRIIGNMSDAQNTNPRQEYWNMDALFREIFDKIAALTVNNDVTLNISHLNENIISIADRQELERATLNLISNALKFTAPGGHINCELVRRGRTLYLRIQDDGSGMSDDVRRTVFSRYLRAPAIEDSRNGIGLGMVVVRAAAVHHGGTVLIDQPKGSGVRVTMTIAIRQNSETTLRSPISGIDYAGGLDHALIELSDCLPPEMYADY